VKWLPNINGLERVARTEAENEAVNAPVQSTASDLTLLAAHRAMRRVKEQGLQTRFVLPVHDSLMFTSPQEETKAALAIIQEEMERKILHPQIPFDVDMTVTDRWKGEKIKLAA
jgi:DNA polymerase-1